MAFISLEAARLHQQGQVYNCLSENAAVIDLLAAADSELAPSVTHTLSCDMETVSTHPTLSSFFDIPVPDLVDWTQAS